MPLGLTFPSGCRKWGNKDDFPGKCWGHWSHLRLPVGSITGSEVELGIGQELWAEREPAPRLCSRATGSQPLREPFSELTSWHVNESECLTCLLRCECLIWPMRNVSWLLSAWSIDCTGHSKISKTITPTTTNQTTKIKDHPHLPRKAPHNFEKMYSTRKTESRRT